MFFFFKRLPKPYAVGYITVDHGHQIFYQQFGNPEGQVVLSFHGGPGGSGKVKHAMHYNLKKYRVILFDQRGCGQSRFTDAFAENTVPATVRDGMAILNVLKIKGKVIVAGASFGAGLALLFAEAYPRRVSRLILNSVFLMRRHDVDWVTHQSRLFYPDLMERMRIQAGSDNLIPFYHRLMFSDKYLDIQQAQKYYGAYERQLGSLTPSFDKTPALTDNVVRSGRIYLHYEKNHFFIKENQILNQIERIKHIPTLIVHNRLDFCCPLVQAYDLHRALPQSKLIIVPARGHGHPLLFRILEKEIKKLLDKN